MCSRSASVETGLIYRSHIQILIQQVKITHKKLCLNKLNKTINTIILLSCKCSIYIVSISVTNLNKIISLSNTHTHAHTHQAHSFSQRFYELD